MSPMYECTKCGYRHKEDSKVGREHAEYREDARPSPPPKPVSPTDLVGEAIPDDVKPTTINPTRATGVERWGWRDWSDDDSDEMKPLDVHYVHWSPNYRLEVWEGRRPDGVMTHETRFTPLQSLVHAKKIAEARGEKYGWLRAWKDKRRLKAYKKEAGE